MENSCLFWFQSTSGFIRIVVLDFVSWSTFKLLWRTNSLWWQSGNPKLVAGTFSWKWNEWANLHSEIFPVHQKSFKFIQPTIVGKIVPCGPIRSNSTLVPVPIELPGQRTPQSASQKQPQAYTDWKNLGFKTKRLLREVSAGIHASITPCSVLVAHQSASWTGRKNYRRWVLTACSQQAYELQAYD